MSIINQRKTFKNINKNHTQNYNDFINPFSTPNKKNNYITQNNQSGLSSPLSKISDNNSILNSESQGLIKVKEITNEDILSQKFEQYENQISTVCHHYVSMKNIFTKSTIQMKNEILNYLGSFNLSAQNSINNINNNCYIATKYFEELSSLKELIDKNKKEIENLIQKNIDEKNENTKKYIIQCDEIKKLNKTIKQLTKNIDDKEKELEQYKVQLIFLRDQIGKNGNNEDVITIDYYLETPRNKNNNLSMAEVEISNLKMENGELKAKNKRAEKNFNNCVKLLTNTCNKAVAQFRELYKKVEGKEWVNEFQACEYFYTYNSYNICEEFSWVYISNMLDAINDLIKSSFGLISKPLNNKITGDLKEDSYHFLTQHFISLNKIIKIQKELISIQNSILNSDSYANIKKEVNGLKDYIINYEEFLTNNKEQLKKEEFHIEFKDLFTKEKMENTYYQDYLNEIKQNFDLTKEFMSRMENDLIKNKNFIEDEKTENIENKKIEINNDKNFTKENRKEVCQTCKKNNLIENNNIFNNEHSLEISANNKSSSMRRLSLNSISFSDEIE